MILLAMIGCQAYVDFYSQDRHTGNGDGTGIETGEEPGVDGPGPVEGIVTGTVRVELYTESSDGAREFISMQEAYGGNFPYGPVFITATTLAADGSLTHHGSDVILEPDPDGDVYEIEVRGSAGAMLTVYGALDADGDGTIHSSDPTGLYPEDLEFSESATLSDVDISILVAYDSDLVGTHRRWEGGQDGGQGCTDLVVQGPVEIENLGEGSRGVAMLADSAGAGPVDWVWFEAEPQGEGGTAEYTISACDDLGKLLLIGAFDTNGNEIIDPEDEWGGWSDESGADLNPVTIGSEDLLDYRVRIPLGDGSSPLDLVPFVQLGGTVSVQDGSFDDLASGSQVFVTALKYRPSNDLNVGSLDSIAYDTESYEWPELTGQHAMDFRLGVPADTVVYLWAFADEDLDGIINESGERVASGGADDEGTFSTGSSDSNQNLPLAHAEE